MNKKQLKKLHSAMESAEIQMEREKAYALRHLIAAKTALDKSLEILRDYMTDYPERDDWNFVDGSIFACIELARYYLDEFDG